MSDKKKLVVEVQSSTYDVFIKSFSGVIGADVSVSLTTGLGMNVEFSGVLTEVLED